MNGKCYSQDNGKDPSDLIIKKSEKIAEILDLESFSYDLMETRNSVYVIDVNPASGFYTSKFARNSFLNLAKDKSY